MFLSAFHQETHENFFQDMFEGIHLFHVAKGAILFPFHALSMIDSLTI